LAESGIKIKKSRGKGFPVMPLDDAVTATKRAGSYGREHSLDDYAGFLGHSTSNSGPFRRKMAALKDWGLIERDGDRVVLPDLAMRIAHPDSPQDEQGAITQAFRQEPMFAEVYDEASKGVELSLAFLGGRAVNAFGVAPASKDRFAKSFARSVQVAGLGSFEGDAITLTGEPSDEMDMQNEDGISEIPRERKTVEPPNIGSSPTLRQEWQVDGGRLVFEAHLDSPLPAAAYSTVGGVAAAVEELAAVLGISRTEGKSLKEDPGGKPIASES
jgi:hypothetical protein